MKEFYVTIQLVVQAETAADAAELGFNAACHLVDTFNDNGSISPLVSIETQPIETKD